MGNEFDNAKAATEEMFENEVQYFPGDAMQNETPSAAPELSQQEQTNGEASATATQKTVLEEATQTAEAAAQTAVEKDTQLQQVMQQLEAMKTQNEQLLNANSQLQGTIEELSNSNREQVVNEALEPPTLDINGLAFADEETQKAAMAKYAEDMSAYNRQQLMKEMSPALEYAKKGMRDAETREVVAALSQIPELANIQEMLPQLDRIIENNKWLQSEDMPLDEKYINAYAMARGIDTINNPPAQSVPAKEPTPEELLAIYNNNPAFQELVEKQRIEQLKQSQQVPPFSASAGAVNAALNIKEKPKTFEEASQRTREMFGMN